MYLASVSLSLHREDGTTPRFVTATPLDVSQDYSSDEEEEGEKIHLLSAQRAKAVLVFIRS